MVSRSMVWSVTVLGMLSLASCAQAPGGETTSSPTLSSPGPVASESSSPPMTSEEPVTSTPTETWTTPSPQETQRPSTTAPETSPSSAVPSTAVPTTATPPSAPPSVSAPAAAAWVAMNTKVTSAEQAKSLRGTSQDFQAFVAERVSTTDEDGCRSEITVTGWHPDGYAIGDDFAPGCGGAMSVWGRGSGGWTVLVAMQDAAPCSQLKKARIPTGAPGLSCLNAAGTVVEY